MFWDIRIYDNKLEQKARLGYRDGCKQKMIFYQEMATATYFIGLHKKSGRYSFFNCKYQSNIIHLASYLLWSIFNSSNYLQKKLGQAVVDILLVLDGLLS